MLFADAFDALQIHVEGEFCVTLYLIVLTCCKVPYLAGAACFEGGLY